MPPADLDRLADARGLIRTESSLIRSRLVAAVRAGLLVRLSYSVFSLPEGG